MARLSTKTYMTIAVVVVLVLVGLFCASAIVDSNKSGEFIIKQAAVSGDMSAIVEEGVFAQFWGDLHRYPRSDTYYFSSFKDEGGERDESIPVTFRNGSQGTVSGSIRFDYPLVENKLIEIHRRFRSHGGVLMDLIRTEVRKLISITASLISPEAAMTQKGLYLQMLVDQLHNGQYQTEPYQERYEDPVTKQVRYRDVVRVKMGEDGKPLRLNNPFEEWAIQVSQEDIQNIH